MVCIDFIHNAFNILIIQVYSDKCINKLDKILNVFISKYFIIFFLS